MLGSRLDNITAVWQPLPGSQEMAVSCPCNEIFYEGTRGPGKTDAQIMFFRKHVGVGFGSFWRGVIFDREYKNLDDLISKSKRWFPEFKDGARFLSSNSAYKWIWPTGEELLFRQAKSVDDYWKYHGQEFPFIGWNELTKFPDSGLFDAMMSCNRSSFIPPPGSNIGEIPLVVFATMNPFGVGHNWIKEKIIDKCPPGKVVFEETDVFNPRTQKKEKIKRSRVRIFGSYKENKYLSPEYIAILDSITDENQKKAWLWGDWDITSGGFFDDLWRNDKHVIKPFKIPSHWYCFRSFDWGSSKPFSCGWWAESDGTEAPDGRFYPRGALIRFSEWYGCQEGKYNEGLKLTSKEVAQGIKERDELFKKEYGIKISDGVADPAIFSSNDGPSIAENMESLGIYWEKADNARITGWEQLRERLKGEDGKPTIYFFDTCLDSIRTLPVAPRDTKKPDDIDTEYEDHAVDEIRYACMSRKKTVFAGKRY